MSTPKNTIAGSHLAGAKIIGARIVTALNTTTSSSTGQPSSVTNQDGYQLKTNDQGSIWVSQIIQAEEMVAKQDH